MWTGFVEWSLMMRVAALGAQAAIFPTHPPYSQVYVALSRYKSWSSLAWLERLPRNFVLPSPSAGIRALEIFLESVKSRQAPIQIPTPVIPS